jgi:Ca-activated chloride channel family protein
MKRIRYSKYVPDPAGEMSMEDLLGALSDYLLQSGFNDNFWYEMQDGDQTLDELRRALEQALLESDSFDEEMRDRLQQMQMNGELEQMIEKLIERMQQEDYISIDQPHDPAKQSSVGGQVGEGQQAKFESGFSRIQGTTRSFGLAWQVELRSPRHTRHGYRYRGQRRFETI